LMIKMFGFVKIGKQNSEKFGMEGRIFYIDHIPFLTLHLTLM